MEVLGIVIEKNQVGMTLVQADEYGFGIIEPMSADIDDNVLENIDKELKQNIDIPSYTVSKIVIEVENQDPNVDLKSKILEFIANRYKVSFSTKTREGLFDSMNINTHLFHRNKIKQLRNEINRRLRNGRYSELKDESDALILSFGLCVGYIRDVINAITRDNFYK